MVEEEEVKERTWVRRALLEIEALNVDVGKTKRLGPTWDMTNEYFN